MFLRGPFPDVASKRLNQLLGSSTRESVRSGHERVEQKNLYC
jgi:hypothetical protein